MKIHIEKWWLEIGNDGEIAACDFAMVSLFMTFFMVVSQEIIYLFWGICTKSCKVLAALKYV